MTFKIKTFIFLFVTAVLFFVINNVDNVKAAMCSVTQDNCVEWSGTKEECESAGGIFSATDVCAAIPWCFCSDNVVEIVESNYVDAERTFESVCKRAPVCSVDIISQGRPKKYAKCQLFGGDDSSKTVCEAAKTQWDASKAAAIQKFSGFTSGQQANKSKIIPDCALSDDLGKESPCRDVSIFVEMGINAASYLFQIIGALALLMFVYGGITLVISSGNPEKVKQGGGIIMSAILGLIIVFGAYVLVQFLGTVLGVSSNLL